MWKPYESSSLQIKTFPARSANSPPWTSIFPYKNVYQLFQAGMKEFQDSRRTTLGRKKFHRLSGLIKVKTTTKALRTLVFLHATQATRRTDTSRLDKPGSEFYRAGSFIIIGKNSQKRLLEHIIIWILIKNHCGSRSAISPFTLATEKQRQDPMAHTLQTVSLSFTP